MLLEGSPSHRKQLSKHTHAALDGELSPPMGQRVRAQPTLRSCQPWQSFWDGS